MKAIARMLPLLLTGLLSMLCPATAWAAPTAALPSEAIIGLAPGKNTVNDAIRTLGRYDLSMPGSASFYAGGDRASTAYRWSPGITSASRGITVETAIGGTTITVIMIDSYPGLSTEKGLTTLVGDERAVELYGLPDYVFEWRFGDQLFRELFYIDEGLQLVLAQVPGRANWTITKMLLSYPAFLCNAVSMRFQMAQNHDRVEEISSQYRTWARHAIPAE